MKEEVNPSPGAVSFGVFEVDLKGGELRKRGIRIKLQDQPFQVLEILLERPGEVVTREELQQRIWPADTFVDFDHGLNNAIKRLREALSDSADTPRYVETLPRRGYRFIAAVNGAGGIDSPAGSALPVSATGREVRTVHRKLRIAVLAIAVGAVVVFGALVGLNFGGLRDRLFTAVGARHGGPLRKIESIAVIPLTNLSGDPAQEYFADGMTEELITDLSQISALKVISRTSVMRYKKTDKSLPEIARELGVDAVVEGTVLRSGDQVRITAQLIHGTTDRHLWGASFERGAEDVLALQREVARAIAEQIRVTLTPREQARLASARPVNLKAHEAYLQGRFHLNKWGEEEWRKAIKYFEQAAKEDPNYALAYAGTADAYLGANWIPPREARPIARAAAVRALALDPTLAEAHLALGNIKSAFDWDWRGAEKEYQQALELNPNLARAHSDYAWYFHVMKRWDEAFREAQRAQELNPLSADARRRLGSVFEAMRQHDQAIDQYRKALEIDPNDAQTHWELEYLYEDKGMYKDAVNEWHKAMTLYGEKEFAEALNRGYARAGYKGAVQEWIRALKRRSTHTYVHPFFFAEAYAKLGDKHQALAWLLTCYEERDANILNLNVDPLWDPYRSDPQFQALLRRVGLPL